MARRLVTSVLSDQDWTRLLSPGFSIMIMKAFEIIRRGGNKPISNLAIEKEVRSQGYPCIFDLPMINQVWRDAHLPYQMVIVKRSTFRRSTIQIFLTEEVPETQPKSPVKPVREGPHRKPGRPQGSRTRGGSGKPLFDLRRGHEKDG
jgi:hypothetical protein